MTKTERARVRRWIAALRSGKYTQGRRALRTPEGHNCCLGVLCEVEGAKFAPASLPDGAYFLNDRRYDNLDTELSGLLPEVFGPHMHNELLYGASSWLAEMNDAVGDKHHTFEDIANVLEDTLVADRVLGYSL